MSWLLRSTKTREMLSTIKPFGYRQLDADVDEKQSESDSLSADTHGGQLSHNDPKHNRYFAFLGVLLGIVLGAILSIVIMQTGSRSKHLDRAQVVVEERRVVFPDGALSNTSFDIDEIVADFRLHISPLLATYFSGRQRIPRAARFR